MNLSTILAAAPVAITKVSKSDAGYIHRHTDYRCIDCWQFDPTRLRCASHGLTDVIHANGYCTYWQYGKPLPGLPVFGSLNKIESGYAEDPNGTQCRRCVNFDAGFCKRVDEKSPGDDTGRIDPGACCSLQRPKNV